MASEIDLLLNAAAKGYLVVAKDSNMLWTEDELLASWVDDRFPEEGRIIPPDAQPIAVTSIFPGCHGQIGASADYSRYVPVGQTEHFLLFGQPEA
jgi:hypothetical protein